MLIQKHYENLNLKRRSEVTIDGKPVFFKKNIDDKN